MGKGDQAAALAGVRRAHAAWPGQWFYAYALASLAAESGETATVESALTDLAALGAGPDLAQDTTLVSLAAHDPAVGAALARVAQNRVPLAGGKTAFEFAARDSDFYPEGIAYDAKSGRLFVASVRHRKVAVIDRARAKGERDFVAEPKSGDVDGLFAARAGAAARPRGRLWVTSAALPRMAGYADADSGRGVIHAFDLATGKRIARHELPQNPAGHVPGDVLVAADGAVYVTDSAYPAIFRVAPDAKNDAPAEEWLADTAFRSLQGQALSADGKTLYVADYSHGIAAIDIANRSVRWLAPPAGMGVLGIDGLARHGSDLIGVQNGMPPARIVRLGLSGRGEEERIASVTLLDRHLPVADEPTMGALVGDDFVYVANSLWEKYDDAGVRVRGKALAAPVLLQVSVK
jgi:outer membrane protein assembly factor BamB